MAMARKANDDSSRLGDYCDRVDEVEYYSTPTVSVVFDARHYPVIIVTWLGHVDLEAAQAMTERVGRVVARIAEEDGCIVAISDTTRMSNKPGPEVRELYARAIDEWDTRHPGRLVGLVVIVEGAIMRGIIAMILWLLRRKVRLITTGSMAGAIERAKALLSGAGLTPPAGLEPHGYQRPLLPGELDDASPASG
jgi:hypothetical protein